MKIRTPAGILALLLGINILNYVDRQVVYALLPLIQKDMNLSDAQAGSLASAFMIVYMLAAPPIAWLADSRGRRPWLAGGVALWSLATGMAGQARSFLGLFVTRSAVGIGEACYGAVSPTLISEQFPSQTRGRALAIFSMAIPVGSALGYVGGGLVGEAFGWRKALWMVGLPGLALSALCLLLPDDAPQANPPSATAGYRDVWSIPSFRQITFAGAAMTFALGGFAVWMPTFFHRAFQLSVGRAGTLFGAVTVLGGLTGSLLGGWIADRLRPRLPHADLLVSGTGLLAGMPLAMAAILSPNLRGAVVALFAAESLLFLNMGPLNSAIAAVTRPSVRSMAFAANIFVVHLLGDAASPTLIGWGSDVFGLTTALLAACAALGVGGAFCFAARKSYLSDCARTAQEAA